MTTKTYTTATNWAVRYDTATGTGTATYTKDGAVPPTTFRVDPVHHGLLVVFTGDLPPHHVVSAVQSWISAGCPGS